MRFVVDKRMKILDRLKFRLKTARALSDLAVFSKVALDLALLVFLLTTSSDSQRLRGSG